MPTGRPDDTPVPRRQEATPTPALTVRRAVPLSSSAAAGGSVLDPGPIFDAPGEPGADDAAESTEGIPQQDPAPVGPPVDPDDELGPLDPDHDATTLVPDAAAPQVRHLAPRRPRPSHIRRPVMVSAAVAAAFAAGVGVLAAQGATRPTAAHTPEPGGSRSPDRQPSGTNGAGAQPSLTGTAAPATSLNAAAPAGAAQQVLPGTTVVQVVTRVSGRPVVSWTTVTANPAPRTTSPGTPPRSTGPASAVPQPTAVTTTAAAPATTAATVPPGQGIVNFASASCISAGAGKDGTRLTIQGCSGSANQHWVIESNGTIQAEGLCMDAAGAGTGNGTPVQVARCNGGPAQHFVLNTSYDLVNVNAHRCVALVGAGTAAGTALELRDCNGQGYEKWRTR